MGLAAIINNVEVNNTFATAQVLSGGAFTLDFDANIGTGAGVGFGFVNTSTTPVAYLQTGRSGNPDPDLLPPSACGSWRPAREPYASDEVGRQPLVYGSRRPLLAEMSPPCWRPIRRRPASATLRLLTDAAAVARPVPPDGLPQIM